jgi:blue copper oxidase
MMYGAGWRDPVRLSAGFRGLGPRRIDTRIAVSPRSSPPVKPGRRRLLQLLWAGTLASALPARPGAAARAPAPGTMDLCATPSRFDQPLRVPGHDGLLGYLRADREPLVLRAVNRGGTGPGLALVARVGGRDFVDPTLVAARGAALRITVRNALAEPTTVHWHGLTVDTANDGNGETLIAPGGSFEYAFTVRNRAGLYWYHPHPHGSTAAQAYRGMFGLLAVEDDEEIALRHALELVPGDSEIPLVLHDRRAQTPDRYAPSSGDLVHGWYGDESLVNFTSRPYLDVDARRYRFRILNAANARIYRLGFRNDRGDAVPFLLIGTDGGLLEQPRRVAEVFVAPAERVDILVDLAAMAIGDFVLLESRAFDPMHGELASTGGADAGAEAPHDHAHAMGDGGSLVASSSDGSPHALLQFRIRRRASTLTPQLPSRLSVSAAPVAPTGDDKPMRLGFDRGRWRINDRVYDMGATPIVAARNAVETWIIRNPPASMPHAMHLHGFPFRVLARETSPGPLAPLAIDVRGRVATDSGWKDTVLVWPGESVRISIDFRHPFAGDQIYLFHCHNLEHEDSGMMLRVKVG